MPQPPQKQLLQLHGRPGAIAASTFTGPPAAAVAAGLSSAASDGGVGAYGWPRVLGLVDVAVGRIVRELRPGEGLGL